MNVGCKPEWDQFIENYTKCTNNEKVIDYLKSYVELSELQQNMVVETSMQLHGVFGC